MKPPRAAPNLQLEGLTEDLGDYTRFALSRSVEYARRLHAERVSPEHVLASLLEDEECGATRLVLHAFADPATLGIEVMAMCTGIMAVSYTHLTLPTTSRV